MNAKHDENSRPTLIATSNVDGVTIVPIQANPTTHAIKIEDGISGSDVGNNSGIAMIDENSVPVMWALSSVGDGSLVEVYSNPSTGAILTKST